MNLLLIMAELINNETLSIILVAIFLILLYKWSSTTTNSSPPSPRKLPIIGNLHQLGSSRSPLHLALRALSQVHGHLMLLHLGSVPVLVVSSAEAAQEIMKTHDLTFCSRPDSTVFKKLLYNSKDVAMSPYGEYWRQVKSICVLNLLSNKRVRSYRNVREEETKAMMRKIREGSKGGEVINLRDMLMTLTNDVVSRAALGKSYYSDGVFKELSTEHTELLGSLYIGDYIPWLGWLSRVTGLDTKLDRVAKLFDVFLDVVIQEHMGSTIQKGEDEKDFVDVLLEIQHQNSLGFHTDRTSIKAVILDMFLAGTDTIATLVEWTMAEIIKHPKVMTKLQTEIRTVNKGGEEILTEDDLIDMHYLKAVIKETFRLHPPLPLLIPRMSTQDVNLNGYNIKASTQVLVNVWQIGRDPKSYNHKPDEFEPERFLNAKSGVTYKGHDFELTPFGAGRRICPGIQFATSVFEIALANLLHKFDWTMPGGARSEDLDMTESCGLTIHKRHPLKAIATPYSSA